MDESIALLSLRKKSSSAPDRISKVDHEDEDHFIDLFFFDKPPSQLWPIAVAGYAIVFIVLILQDSDFSQYCPSLYYYYKTRSSFSIVYIS